MVLAIVAPRPRPPGRSMHAALHARAVLAVLFLAAALPCRAGILSPDYLFFEPETLPVAVYPSQTITGDGVNTPWQSVWTSADIAVLDPGRYNIFITGADILPVLVANPSTADGSYTTADLTAINLDNYHAYYMQQPGVDILDPATDYVADLTSSVLTVQFNAPAVYAVRIETFSSPIPGGPANEARNYIYRQFVDADFLEDGAPDAAGAQRELDIGDADIYVVSDPTPADRALDNAADILRAKGKTVARAKNLAAAQKAICDAATARGRKVSVNMVGHGRAGSINIGGERITDDADKKSTPATFQKSIDKCASSITFTSCKTADGAKGSKFLRDFANSIGTATGWIVTLTVEAPVKNKDGSVKKAGFFDVEATGRKLEEAGIRSTGPIYSSPTWFRADGADLFFFGADDGFLYAQTAIGGVVTGFPVDTRSMGLPGTTDAVPIRSRPATYFGSDSTPSLYFTTAMGHVVSVALDGAVRWVAWPDPTAFNCSSTPAVTPDGSVYVALNGASGPRVWKLDAATGAIHGQSPPLGMPGSDSSALSVANNLIYLGITQAASGQGALVVLDTSLTPRAAGIATGEAVIAPPFVRGPYMYDGTLAGNLYRVNSVTTAPDPSFAGDGSVALGEPMDGGPFVVELTPGTTDIYVGTMQGRVYHVDGAGSPSLLFDAATSPGGLYPVGGLMHAALSSRNVLAFSAGRAFYVLPLPSEDAYMFDDLGRPGGGFSTTPVYVPSLGIFAIGNRDGILYMFPVS